MAIAVLPGLIWIEAGLRSLQPMIGIAASSAMFGDSMGLLFVVGVILILGGLALTVISCRTANQGIQWNGMMAQGAFDP